LKIDSNNIFVIGHSGGAYLALMSGYFLENPPKAIVTFYGYGEIQSEWYNKPDSFYLRKTMYLIFLKVDYPTGMYQGIC
jgi:predicted esterase